MKCPFDNLVTCSSCTNLGDLMKETAFIIVGHKKTKAEKLQAINRLKSFDYRLELKEFQTINNILIYGAENGFCKPIGK